MTIKDVVLYCSQNAEFVAEWARLRDVNLPRTPMDHLIDDATGRSSDIARLFIEDVIDLVVCRLPPQTIEETEVKA